MKKTRKFAEVKRLMNPKDLRLTANKEQKEKKDAKAAEKEVHHVYANGCASWAIVANVLLLK